MLQNIAFEEIQIYAKKRRKQVVTLGLLQGTLEPKSSYEFYQGLSLSSWYILLSTPRHPRIFHELF